MNLRRPFLWTRHGVFTLVTVAAAVAAVAPVAMAGTNSSSEVPSVEFALAEVERVAAELADAKTNLDVAVERRDSIDDRIVELGAEDQLLVERIELTKSRARDLAVHAYIQGGTLSDAELLLEAGGAQDFSRRAFLIEDQAARTTSLVEELDTLLLAASKELLDLVQETDDIRRVIDISIARIEALTDELDQAAENVVVSSAWELSDYAVQNGRYGEASESHWAKLRHCESTNNYGAVDATGVYRGAYQFDRATWRTVGGSGDPAQAPPLEQDARARALFASRGNEPWPKCGRFLPQVS